MKHGMCRSITPHFLSLGLLTGGAAFSGAQRPDSAAVNDAIFSVGVDLENEEWTTISPAEVVRLVEEAVAKQSEYGSGRARLLIYVSSELTADRDAVVKIFGQLKTNDSPAKLREVTAPIARHEEGVIQKWNWSNVSIAEDGGNAIERLKAWSSETWPSTYLTTDKIKIIYEGAQKQADVALPGLQNRTIVDTLASFFNVLQPVKEQYIASAATTSDYVKLIRGSMGGSRRTIIFSRRDGNVIYDHFISADGKRTKETWQDPMKEWRGGVRYPASQLQIRCVDGAVTFVQAAVVKEAAFNVLIDPAELAVSIPAGTAVVDSRNGDPTVVRVKQPIDDLYPVLADGPLAERAERRDVDLSPLPSRRMTMILLNIVIIAVLLVVILIIRRRGDVSHM